MFVAELNQIITTAESINVCNDGQIRVYTKNEPGYEKIIEGWVFLTEHAHEMPAFGVSLNDETIEAKNSGLWVEFVFDRQQTHSSMTFKKLLIKVERQWQGFNIVRYTEKDGYSGRCYFLDLNGNDMSQFYDILADL